MNELKMTLRCQFCNEKEEVAISTEFTVRYGEINIDSFCEKHKNVERFFDEQCTGCVSGWDECRLFDKLDLGLTDGDKDLLRCGRCPNRINGTMIVQHGSVEKIDLSTPATDNACESVIQAFADYYKNYVAETIHTRR